ncbi:MAG TPA: VOC family protein [Burkholderiaceae bacterium]|nr:VOC family protein [Burkholderiaceae bacterium]
MSTHLALDHLVVAARTLDEGVQWCEATLGLTPIAGGTHPLMGTHNRVFAIGSKAWPRAYFEIIAIDPSAAPPGRARWFGLDMLDLRQGPRLVHWVARVAGLDAALAALGAAGCDAGRALAASRDTPAGRLEWRIAVRDDGALLAGGAWPTLIEWGAVHPGDAMPPSGVTLRGLAWRGVPAAWSATLALDGIAPQALGAGPSITAELDTPRGPVTLCSH